MEFDYTTQLRIIAVQTAAGGAKAGTSPVKVAEDIFDFLTADAASPATSTKPSGSGAKAKQDDAPDTGTDAPEPSSEKPAAKEKATTATSPSEDKGSGFTGDGSEITLDDIRTAAVKFSAHPKGGEKKFVAKLKELGSDNLSGLDPSRYGELIDYLEGATAEGKAEAEVSPFE